MEHALDCKKGGLVTQRHNEVRDVIGDLASVVFKEVVKEPVVQEANEAEGVPSLIADLSIRRAWSIVSQCEGIAEFCGRKVKVMVSNRQSS